MILLLKIERHLSRIIHGCTLMIQPKNASNITVLPGFDHALFLSKYHAIYIVSRADFLVY